MYKQLIIFWLIGISFSAFSQDTRGVQKPTTADKNVCKHCINAIQNKPKEVSFGVTSDEKGDIYLEINDKKWISSVFKSSKDGIMLDIVSKDRYNCSLESIPEPDYGLRGTTLPVISGKKIISSLKEQTDGQYKGKIGVVPTNLRSQELEFNIFFISNNFFCYYHLVYNLESNGLEFLDPGMYLDTLTYSDEFETLESDEAYKLRYKKLKFVVPFERNKAVYSEQDIKPIYDSLKLTEFDIKKISIKAYSSVEGSLKRNIQLQEQRATSIAKALQNFQTPKIKNVIEAKENWVDFFNDISKSKYASLAKLSKKEIKSKLVGSVNKDLEVYLKKHRKAVISLDLEKKDPYKKFESDELIRQFSTSVAKKDIEEARKIQSIIFERIKNNVISPDSVKKLEVPNSEEFLDVKINNLSIDHLLDVRTGMIVYNQLKELEKQFPNNKKIKYNIVAVTFTIWRNQWQEINPEKFKKQILSLKKYGIPKLLIDRLLINYNIKMSYEYLLQGQYSKKDKSLNAIYAIFKTNSNVRDKDYLHLSKYFASYARRELALEILDKKIKELTVDEDLLFYYLNLTIIDPEITKTDNYKTIINNAIAHNESRFCSLFNRFKKEGGITFQLLEDQNLRNIYCESCN